MESVCFLVSSKLKNFSTEFLIRNRNCIAMVKNLSPWNSTSNYHSNNNKLNNIKEPEKRMKKLLHCDSAQDTINVSIVFPTHLKMDLFQDKSNFRPSETKWIRSMTRKKEKALFSLEQNCTFYFRWRHPCSTPTELNFLTVVFVSSVCRMHYLTDKNECYANATVNVLDIYKKSFSISSPATTARQMHYWPSKRSFRKPEFSRAKIAPFAPAC